MSTVDTYEDFADEAGVRVYALGVCSASACAPACLSAAGVAHAVNAMEPTGIDTPWEVAGEPFATGEPNPCPCNTDPDGRRHWLLHC